MAHLRWLGAAALLGVIPVAQACPELGSVLALDEAVRLAWCQHPSQARSAAQVQAKEGAVAGVQATRRPTLGLTGGWTRDRADSDGPAAQETSSGQIQASWQVFDGGVRSARLESAQQQLSAAQASKRFAQSQQALLSAQAWLAVATAEGVLAAREQQVEEARLILDIAKTQQELGRLTGVDVRQAEAHWYQAQLQQVQAEVGLTQAQAQLHLAVGSRDPLPALADLHQQEEHHLNRDMPEGDGPSADVVALTQQLAAADAGVAAARASYRPTVTVTAAQRWTGRDHTEVGGWTAGVSLSVPLYAGGARSAQVTEALAAKHSAQAVLGEAQHAWEAARTMAKHRREMAEVSLESAQAAFAAAVAGADLATGRYKTGVGNLQEVVQAHSLRTTAMLSLVQARTDRLYNQFNLEHLTGVLVDRFTQVDPTQE